MNMEFILLINAQIPQSSDFNIFISRINFTAKSFNARKICIFQYFSFYKQLNIHAQLSMIF